MKKIAEPKRWQMAKPHETVRIGFRLTPKEHQSIKRGSTLNGITMAAYVRMLIEKDLQPIKR
jgi:predicted DNA binding CopG/RHH family protein